MRHALKDGMDRSVRVSVVRDARTMIVKLQRTTVDRDAQTVTGEVDASIHAARTVRERHVINRLELVFTGV